MHAEANAPVLVLFAKVPMPGRVKTRLMPELSAVQAAEVAAELIKRTVLLVVEHWPGPVRLYTWPDTGHLLFKNLAAAHNLPLVVQSTGDLGIKMYAALSAFTDHGRPAAVMGCDVPHCPAENLHRAGDLLARGENIIGPSTDGGYYLIGLQHTPPEIFRDIQWGGEGVLSSTLRIAAHCGIHFTHLSPVTDIDNFEDLQMLARAERAFSKWTVKPRTA